ncbi:MAG TPA: GPW/gp25 family protein [Ornithinimicrobium sp.]|nr:GPW/gp25 family protein [Ornithinimicrobium sp.]
MTGSRYRAVHFAHPYLGVTAGPPGLQVASSGRLATVQDAAAVRQSLLLLLSTRPGERVNRPRYGCHLFRLAFEAADNTTAGLAIHYVARAVEEWEPRVEVLSLEAGAPPDAPHVLDVRMHYRVRTTQQEGDLTVAVPTAGGAA